MWPPTCDITILFYHPLCARLCACVGCPPACFSKHQRGAAVVLGSAAAPRWVWSDYCAVVMGTGPSMKVVLGRSAECAMFWR